jgi:uncharacterized SAM-binding protein YcdF (DUF218 family)
MWQEWAFYWLSPFILAMEVWLAAIAAMWIGRRRLALALSIIGFAGLWLGSLPVVADALGSELESQNRALLPQDTPSADAILVLGGALVAAQPPERPNFVLGESSTRILHAAALYRAGKAKWIVVAAGNRPGHMRQQIEADAIAEFLMQLGVPDSAIKRERASRTTRENAANVKPLLEALGAHRVLLVTSAMHMPRALKTFETVWGPTDIQLVPAVTDVRVVPRTGAGLRMWLPSLEALLSVTKSLKEFAGMAVVAIIR